MGGAASVLPERLDEEMCMKFSHFSPSRFIALREESKNNTVSRDLALAINTPGVEREVFVLYMKFCDSGEMDSETFVQLVGTIKLLNKTFNRAIASQLFDSHLPEGKLAINFVVFRVQLVPDVSRSKEVPLATILQKIAVYDGPIPGKTGLVNSLKVATSKSSKIPALSAMDSGTDIEEYQPNENTSIHRNDTERNINREIAVDEVDSSQSIGAGRSSKEVEAVKTIQAAIRIKVAKQQVSVLKEVETIRKSARHITGEGPVLSQEYSDNLVFTAKVQSTDEVTDVLSSVFNKFCKVPNEMDLFDFKKMCRELNLLTKTFTMIEAEAAFKTSIATIEAEGESGPYAAGVMFGKKINFDVFKNVLIGFTARRRATPMDKFIHLLNGTNSEVPSRTASIDMVVPPNFDFSKGKNSRHPSRASSPASGASRNSSIIALQSM